MLTYKAIGIPHIHTWEWRKEKFILVCAICFHVLLETIMLFKILFLFATLLASSHAYYLQTYLYANESCDSLMEVIIPGFFFFYHPIYFLFKSMIYVFLCPYRGESSPLL